MERHVTAVAALQIGFSILSMLLAAFIFIVLTAVGFYTYDESRFILWIVATGVGSFLFLMSVPGIIGGIGLFKRKHWARILVLILSAIDLLNFPLGTALGVYSIWVLVHPDAVELFD